MSHHSWADRRYEELDRREELAARRARFAPPVAAGYCPHCGSPPGYEYGCPTCGRPVEPKEYPEVTRASLEAARSAHVAMNEVRGSCEWGRYTGISAETHEARRRYREHQETIEKFEQRHAVRLMDVIHNYVPKGECQNEG